MHPLHQLWQQADQAQAQAQHHYPEMRCRSGCNDCCKHHGSPITYAPEWQEIASWLASHPAVEARVRERFQQLKKQLQARMQNLTPPSLSEALFEAPCPFIEQERCQIYAVRPLTCRAFGNTALQQPVRSGEDLYTCNPEKDRWEKALPMHVELPLRQHWFETLEQSGPALSLLHFLDRHFYEPC